MRLLPLILTVGCLFGCQPQPHYEVRRDGNTFIRTETRSGKVEILTPQRGWQPAEERVREWWKSQGGR